MILSLNYATATMNFEIILFHLILIIITVSRYAKEKSTCIYDIFIF